MDDLSIVAKLLTPDNVALVYPLVAQISPGMDRQRWLRMGGRLAYQSGVSSLRRGGVVVFVNGSPLPCGAALFRHDSDIQFGRILSAHHFVVMAVSCHREILGVMTEYLEALAHKAGCGAMRCTLRIEDSFLAQMMEFNGLKKNSVALIKDFRR